MKKRFVIYLRAFTEHISNKRKVLIKLFAEVFVECEVKPDEDIKAL